MGSCLWDCWWAGIEKGTLRGNWLGQLRPPQRADVPSGQRMDIRLARGSINLSFFKSRLQEGKKNMHSGCKKLFPSCLPLSTGADVFTSAGWLLSCWGQGTSRKSHLPVPTTQESKPQVLIAFVGKFIEKFCKNGLKSELNLQWVPPRNQHRSQA